MFVYYKYYSMCCRFAMWFKKKWMLGLDQQSHVGRAVMVRGVPLNSNIGNLSNHMSKYHLLLKRGNTNKEYTQSLKERTI